VIICFVCVCVCVCVCVFYIYLLYIVTIYIVHERKFNQLYLLLIDVK